MREPPSVTSSSRYLGNSIRWVFYAAVVDCFVVWSRLEMLEQAYPNVGSESRFSLIIPRCLTLRLNLQRHNSGTDFLNDSVQLFILSV